MRARRSCLSVPGSSRRMLAKAAGLPADEVVIDLEDAVAASAKDEARAAVVSALAEGQMDGRTVAVRVNGLETPWCHRDIVALADGPAAGAVTSLVVPKVQAPEDIVWVARLLDAIGTGEKAIRLQALIETAAGLRRAGDIGQAGPRLEALILGYADLRASLGRPADDQEPPDRWSFAQETVLVAARAGGLQAIDGPHLRVGDAAGLQAGRPRSPARVRRQVGDPSDSAGHAQRHVLAHPGGGRACAWHRRGACSGRRPTLAVAR